MFRNVTKLFVLLVFGLFLVLPAWSAGQQEEKLVVAAAANISSLGEPLAQAFGKKYPGFKVEWVFGASGALTTQIQNGAPYLVFMSADTGFPEKLAAGGFTASKPAVYARGKLILLSKTPVDFSKGLAILSEPSVIHFAIANPETAPYGLAAKEALQKAGLWDGLGPKIVTAQSISQALQYSLEGTGIGFVNKSALYTKEMEAYAKAEGTLWIEISESQFSPIDQAFVLLKGAEKSAAAKAWGSFLGSPEARAVFASFGYGLP